MDCEAFIRNQRGLNNDMDFPPEMLAEIFKSIRFALKSQFGWGSQSLDSVIYLVGGSKVGLFKIYLRPLDGLEIKTNKYSARTR